MPKPPSECTVAVVSSAAIALRDSPGFDQQSERENPWRGDPGYRVIPKDATEKDVRVYHLHINNTPVEQDLGCALPTARLADLARAGEIGAVAPHHYSFMGYLLKPQLQTLLGESTAAMIAQMKDDRVDVVLLVAH